MSAGFVCSICGEEHVGLPTDWAYRLPDEVWALPESRRQEESRYSDDLCQWGERFFMRCVLPTPLIGANDSFGWGAWAEVSREVFERYLEFYDKDGSAEPRLPGRLANALSAYAGSMGAVVEIQLRDPKSRPELFLPATDQSLLAEEQRAGVDHARHQAILTLLGVL